MGVRDWFHVRGAGRTKVQGSPCKCPAPTSGQAEATWSIWCEVVRVAQASASTGGALGSMVVQPRVASRRRTRLMGADAMVVTPT